METSRVHLNIPVAHYQSVLSWDQATIDELVKAAVQLAVKVGLRLDDDAEGVYLREVEGKGAKIDWDARAVLFTETDVEETIAVMRKTRPVSKPLRELERTTRGRDEKFGVGNGANLVFDWNEWQPKAPTASDFVEVCQWAQGCDDVEGIAQPFMLKDLDLRLEPLYSYALMCEYCRKPVYHNQPTEPIHVRYLAKMAKIVQQHRGYSQEMPIWEYVNPPFRMGFRGIATMLERVDSGACSEMGIGPMSVSGMSAPVTASGLAVTALAEMLTALTFFRILRPGHGLRANVCTGSLDLRTARVSYFGMHTHLCNLALWELVVRGLGADSGCLTFYRDANEPGMQALYEFGMAQAFFSTLLYRAIPEIGGLACGNTFSPHQAVLDMELIKEFNELIGGFEVSEESLGVEETIRARFTQGVHMSTDHTVAYMKDGVPFSAFLFRGLPGGAQHDKKQTQTVELMEKAQAAVMAAVEQGRAVEPDLDLGGDLYECVKEAARELRIEAPPLA